MNIWKGDKKLRNNSLLFISSFYISIPFWFIILLHPSNITRARSFIKSLAVSYIIGHISLPDSLIKPHLRLSFTRAKPLTNSVTTEYFISPILLPSRSMNPQRFFRLTWINLPDLQILILSYWGEQTSIPCLLITPHFVPLLTYRSCRADTE